MKQQAPTQCGHEDRVRLDKWLWAARFFRTRSLSSEAIDKGRVTVNGLAAKSGREVERERDKSTADRWINRDGAGLDGRYRDTRV